VHCIPHFLSLLIVISILFAIFSSRAAPDHAGTRLGIITSLWLNGLREGNSAILEKKKKKKKQTILYLTWEVLDQLPTALQYLITCN